MSIISEGDIVKLPNEEWFRNRYCNKCYNGMQRFRVFSISGNGEEINVHIDVSTCSSCPRETRILSIGCITICKNFAEVDFYCWWNGNV